jgi:hypothetical protein
VATRSKTWTVFPRSNSGIVGLNPTESMDVCIYSVFLLPCVGSGFATSWSPIQGVSPTVLGLRHWSESVSRMPCARKWETQVRESEIDKHLNQINRAIESDLINIWIWDSNGLARRLLRWILHGFFFDPDVDINMCLRNVPLSLDCKALQSRRS